MTGWVRQSREERARRIRDADHRPLDEDDAGPGHQGPPAPAMRLAKALPWPRWDNDDDG